jgi:hypothetical protein
MEANLSEWHPRDITPVYTGVYEVRIKENGKLIRWFSCWNGSTWGLSGQTPDDAEKYCDMPSDAAEHAGGFEWRGLKEKAE